MNEKHQWFDGGQVVPKDKTATVEAVITEMDDGCVVYKLTDFTLTVK